MALTPQQQDLVLGFNDSLSAYGRTLSVVNSSGTVTGPSFSALLSLANPIDPEFMELGSDLREVSIATVLRPLPSGVVAQTQVQDDSGQNWTIVKRIDNPAEISAQYWMTKVAAGFDTD